VHQGAAAKRDKNDTVYAQLQSLSDDLPIFDFYQVMFPTDDMRTSVAMLYIQILDFLYPLAKYFALGSLGGVFIRFVKQVLTFSS
jgi:triacylglycerol esterase/lipase EstA (alpha/beta hydrolase family)